MISAVVRVGPLALECEVPDGAAGRAIASWLAAHESGDAGPARRRVRVVLTRGAAEADGLAARCTFRRDPAADVYRDESEAWAACLEGFEEGAAPVAVARVRPRVEGERLWFNVARMWLRAVASVSVALDDVLLMHGCAMVDPASGEATLFVGASGDGKTTMAGRLPGWGRLSDDTVLVDLAGRPAVYGTPFPGKEGLGTTGRGAPLARILVLEPHASELRVTPMSPAEAFEQIVARTFWYVPEGPLVARVLDVAQRLAERVPVSRLASNLDHDVAARPWLDAGEPAVPSC